MRAVAKKWRQEDFGVGGVALVMVLLVLTALAILGTPFVVSMTMQERSSYHFDGEVKVRLAAQAAAQHSMAQLSRSVRAAESAREAEERGVLDGSSGRGGRGGLSRSQKVKVRRAGMIRRGAQPGREDNQQSAYVESERGPLPRDFDLPEELEVSMPAATKIPASAPRIKAATDVSIERSDTPDKDITVDFNDLSGITASVDVVDEQGKININTAPPNLIANLFAVSLLKKPLEKRDRSVELEDASGFRADGNRATISGAVVVVHPVSGGVEAITYRDRSGDSLTGLFRGAFFSTTGDKAFPRGSFVYDMRGFKVAYHKFRAGAINGFVTRRLSDFSTIESIREIANWQMASLFLQRLGGQSLTESFLRENGIRMRDLEKAGLDPALFDSDDRYQKGFLKKRLEHAKRSLRKLRLRSNLLGRLEKARGPRAIVALAARFDRLGPEEAKKEAKRVEGTLKSLKNKTPRFERKYLKACLENLAKVYKTRGIETILPDELEDLRDSITVSSWVPSLWSESTVVPDAVVPGDQTRESYRLERSEAHGGGAVVRLRHREAKDTVEFNQTVNRSPAVPQRGFQLFFPVFNHFGSRDARVDFLERHPVNVNTASRRVLTAIFSGIQDARKYKKVAEKGTVRSPGIVTPDEAEALAFHVMSQRPFKGPTSFRDAVFRAAQDELIDSQDAYPIYINSLQPNHYRLRVSTTGFCYASGDVYTLRGRGVLRNDLGGEVTSTAFREIVEVSPPETQKFVLFAQSDFTSEIFFRTPYFSRSATRHPSDHFDYSVTLPGTQGHLVRTTPILYKQLRRYGEEEQNTTRRRGEKKSSDSGVFPFLAVPGGDLGSLQLERPETPDFPGNPAEIREVFHFRNDREEMRNLTSGQTWDISLRMQQLADGQDLTTTGGSSVEAWVRFRTFPDQENDEGFLYLMDTGREKLRNRLSVLYDQQNSEWVARIYDTTAPDPSFQSSGGRSDVVQWVELRKRTTLELDTWYHVRLAWDGTYPGGVQLFLDGFPAESSNLRSELTRNLSAKRDSIQFGDVRDWRDKFPTEGVLRVNQELIEYNQRGLRRWDRTPAPYASFFAKHRFERDQALKFNRLTAATSAPLMRGAEPRDAFDRDNGNRRGGARGDHRQGTPVTIHGYSLPLVRRTVHRSKRNRPLEEKSAAANDQILLGQGGLRLREDLYPFTLPYYDCSLGNDADLHQVRIVNYCEPNPLLQMSQDIADDNVFEGTACADDHINNTQRDQDDLDDYGELEFNNTSTERGAATAGEIAPVFYYSLHARDLATNGLAFPGVSLPPVLLNSGLSLWIYSPTIVYDGQTHNATDFFQSSGVLRSSAAPASLGQRLRYRKRSLKGTHPATQPVCKLLVWTLRSWEVIDCAEFTPGAHAPAHGWILTEPQTQGLTVNKSNGRYPEGQVHQRSLRHGRCLCLHSVLATGPVDQYYASPAGILEIPGTPPPWERSGGARHTALKGLQGRPDYYGRSDPQSLFRTGVHPDDVVEWIRYYDVEGPMFIGDPIKFSNHVPRDSTLGSGRRKVYQHRDFPRGENQLFHPAGAPIRQVVELVGTGAGYGDYVTVSGYDPQSHQVIAESVAWRVFNTLELSDGRFLASLLHPTIPDGRFENTYSADLRVRLEKFPSGFPPRTSRGNLVFFGDAVEGTASPKNSIDYSVEEEITTGFAIDEVRRTWGRHRRRHSRHVLVPMRNGDVETRSLGDQRKVISGVIKAEQGMSVSDPTEVLIVSVGEIPENFAGSHKQGVLRINEEFFFFETVNSDNRSSDETGATASLRAFQLDGSEFDVAGSRAMNPDFRLREWTIRSQGGGGKFDSPGFARIRFGGGEAGSGGARAGVYEIFYYERAGSRFRNCLRGQFQTPIFLRNRRSQVEKTFYGQIESASVRLRLVGRGLLGSTQQTHGVGDPVTLVNYLPVTRLTGPMTDTGIQVTETQGFPPAGYLLLDSAQGGREFEIVAYTGIGGEGLFHRPRDESGRGILRRCFGTQEISVSSGVFAYALPFRHFDRYQPQAESEDLARFQKSLRVPGAHWKSISWRERSSLTGQERLCDVVVAVRFDGEPEWSARPTNKPGGLYVFDARDIGRGTAPTFDIGVSADQIDFRVYFRYQEGAFQFLGDQRMRNDWKETPVLESLVIEYDKAGRVLRHEETEF